MIGIRSGGVKQIGLRTCFVLDAQAKHGLRLVHAVHGLRHTEAGPTVAYTAAADTRHTGDGGYHLTRTFLLCEKEDISTVA